MTTSFLGFPRLPFELRQTIWEDALPSVESHCTRHYIKCLAYFILSQPRDIFFGCGVPTKYDGTIIDDFVRNNPSPFADLAGCSESRVVALKHVKRLLYRDKDLGSWLANPKFPYTDPKLVIQKEGKMIYRCRRITAGLDLERSVFWDFESKKDSKASGSPLKNSMNCDMWGDEGDLKAMEKQQRKEKEKEVDREVKEEKQLDHEREFWEDDQGLTRVEGEKPFPWDDESETEDDVSPSPAMDTPKQSPSLSQPNPEVVRDRSSIKRKRGRNEEYNENEEEERSRKRRK